MTGYVGSIVGVDGDIEGVVNPVLRVFHGAGAPSMSGH